MRISESQILRQYVAITLKWLWLITLCTILAAGAALVVSLSLSEVYEASATLYVTQGSNPELTVGQNVNFNQWLANTYSELLKNAATLRGAASELGLSEIDKDNIYVEPIRQTQLIELRVRDHDPQRAVAIANLLPRVVQDRNQELQASRFSESKESLLEELNWLETEIETLDARIRAIGEPTTAAEEAELSSLQATVGQYRSSYATVLSNLTSIRVSDARTIGSIVLYKEATVPEDPVLPRTIQNTLLAAIVGAILGMGCAFLIEYLDDTIKSAEDIDRALGLGLLGTIVDLRSDQKGGDAAPLVTAAQPRSPVSEAYRTLRTNIQFSGVDKPIHRLLVTSAKPTEGKSLTAANLAVVMAQAGQSVILVDGDLRRPAVHKILAVPNKAGLTDSLIGGTNPGFDDYLQSSSVENLMLLSCGSTPPNPSELLGSQRMNQLVDHLEKRADIVIFDSPPVLAVTDAAVLSGRMDGVLVVVECGRTREGDAYRAVEELSRVNAPILGVVLNKVPVRRGHDYDHYYHYYDQQEKAEDVD